MAINIKEILAKGLLELLETKTLESMTVKDLLNHTGVSRQSFYNHFLDKNDLIQYLYLTRIIPDYHDDNMNINFKESLLVSFNNMKKYHSFMKQACLMEGQNCLKDYIFEHCKEFDLKWHQSLYGTEEMSEALRFATIYHASASSSMTLSWILADMPVSSEEIVDLIVTMRSSGMDKLFEGRKNPYE